MLINEMVIFYYVIQLKSFSKAAEKLGVSKSYVSKHITKLEEDLKTRLLSRSTRQLSLTEAGEVFYQHCQTLFTNVEESYEAIANLRNQPTGTLKISVPPALAIHLLAEPLVKFSAEYPEIKFNMMLESQVVDIIQQGYDLALRSAVLPDSTLIAQKISSLKYILCATPEYIKKHGAITHPDQLTHHVFAAYSGGKTIQQIKFTQGKHQFNIAIDARFLSNNLDLMTKWVMGNCCLAVLPEFMVTTLLANKTIIRCLPEYQLPESPLYAVYPEREFIPLKVKLFIDFLKEYIQ